MMASGMVMVEDGRAAHEAYRSRLRKQRLAWDAHRIPDEREDFQIEAYSQDDEAWFRAKSLLCFQQPSVVLVEKAVVKEELLMGGATRPAGSAQGARAGGKPKPHWAPRTAPRVYRTLELSTENFLEFLFSNRWQDGCLLRVLKGCLLERLLHTLKQLEQYFDVINYSTMAYVIIPTPTKPCRKSVSEVQGMQQQKVMVQLEMYCPQEGITTVNSTACIMSQLSKGQMSVRPGFIPQTSTSAVTADQSVKKLEEACLSVEEMCKIKCNIRGELKPPPHDSCFLLEYHMLQEPFVHLRRRLQSGLSVHLPPVTASEEICSYKKWTDRWQDDYFLGAREDQGTELVSENVVLDTYTDNDDERPGFTRGGAAFSGQRKTLEAQELSKEKKFEAQREKERKEKERLAKEKEKLAKEKEKLAKEKEKLAKENEKPAKEQSNKDATRDDGKTAKAKGAGKGTSKENIAKGNEKISSKERLGKESGGASSKEKNVSGKDKKKAGKLNKKEASGPKDDEVSADEDYEVRPACRPLTQSRANKIEEDLALIATDMLFANNASRPNKCVSTQTKLKKNLAQRLKLRQCEAPQCAEMSKISGTSGYAPRKKPLDQVKPKEPTADQLGENGRPFSSDNARLTNRSERKKSKLGSKQVAARQLKPMKRWDEKPTFNEFFNYLRCPDGDLKQNVGSRQISPKTKELAGFQQSENKSGISSDTERGAGVIQELVLDNKLNESPRANESLSSITLNVIDERKSTTGKTAKNLMTQVIQPDSEQEQHDEESKQRPQVSDLLTEKQKDLIRNRDLIISEMDPWHISLQLADSRLVTVSSQSEAVQRRQRILKLLDDGKVILAINASRLWSITRYRPKKSAAAPSAITQVAVQVEPAIQSSSPQPETMPVLPEDKVTADIGSLAAKKTKSKVKDMNEPDDDKTKLRAKVDQQLPEKEVERKLWKPEDTLIPLVNDDKLPDDISQEEVFDLLHVDKHFVIGKLTSTYSFDQFFKNQMGNQAIQKLRNRFKHPLTDQVKKKKPQSGKNKREPSQKMKSQNAKPKRPDAATKLKQVAVAEISEKPEECEKPPSPTIIGQLKRFKFLNYKDYKPDSCILDREFQFHTVLTDEELFEYMLVAVQMFVVRKERASTAEPFNCRVSVTFTRRPLDDQRMIDFLRENSGDVVSGVCNTLEI